MAGIGKRTLLREVNPYLICPVCRGYLIDATTVGECLHSFCRSCILKHLSKAAHCPSCKHAINKAKPNIKADKALQDIVYKLVPGLYHKEMRKRREFYKKHAEHADSATPEQRGEDVSGRLIFVPEDAVSLSLEYLPPGVDPLNILSTMDVDTNHSHGVNNSNNNSNNIHNNGGTTVNTRRYLQCPALVTIAHLKKFLALKYSVDMTRYTIEICHRRAPLPEHWTLMDVAYIYAWKRIAPMRFFYRVAQEEQKLEAPLHQRPSTPGLGACLPPNDIAVSVQDHGNSDGTVKHSITCRPKIKPAADEPTVEKASNKVSNDNVRSSANNEQKTTITTEDEVKNKSSTIATSSTVTITNTKTSTSVTTAMSEPAMCNNDPNDKQIKSPIKIMKNPDGRYEVLRSPPANWSGKEQAVITAAALSDTKESTSPAEFSVVSIGNGQNSNGVKITLKQRSPTNGTSSKKPKIISNVLLRCAQLEKDSSNTLVVQQLHKNKELSFSPPPVQNKQQEKQRRKVTFVDRPISEKISPSSGNIVPKTALKKTAEQQDKRQFLQGFQLTARESVEDTILKSPIRDIGIANEINSPQKRDNSITKVEGLLEKNTTIDRTTEEEKSNNENIGASNNAVTNTITKRVTGTSANHARNYTSKGSDDADARVSSDRFSSITSPGSVSVNVNANGGHSTAKMDVYTFHSNETSIVPAGAVKRKCPPGVPISDLKRKRQNAPVHNQGLKKQQAVISPPNTSLVKLPRTSSAEHVVPTNRSTNATNASLRADHYHGGLNHVSNVNAKTATSPILSNDTRNLLDGCGLSIPASLSITLTAPKSSGNTGQFVEPLDDNRKVAVLGKVNPSITLNDRSVDPRVLKALKTGQIRMPAVPPKGKSPSAAKQINQNEIHQQLRITPRNKQRVWIKKEQESILDLSGSGSCKKVDMHPLRIPQPVTKLKTNNKTCGRDNVPGDISDQGQVVTLMGGHRYYRAPPGSLTPAAHRVNDCPPLPTPSRTPVYAPTLTDVNRASSNFSSVFPSLQSLYALSQAPNLQQFQMDARLRLPTISPCTSESGGISSAGNCVAGSSDGTLNPSGLNNIPSKTHIAAQCAPIKPARSSIAPLAVPINKQQQPAIDKSANINRTASSDTNKLLTSFQNNDGLASIDESGNSSTQRLTVQTKHPVDTENANRFLSSNNTDSTKNNDQTFSTNEGNSRDSNAEIRSESMDVTGGNSMQSEQQQQSLQDTASPRVSSTASPSPPPGNSAVSSKNDVNADHGDDNAPKTGASDTTTNATSTSPMKKKVDISCKSPASPDSSSVTVESPTGKSCVATIDREKSTEGSQLSDTTKSPSTESIANLENSSSTTNTDSSVASVDDKKNKFVNQSSVDATQKLTSEIVQKRLLAVFPSNEWANNPVAAEHLGNFLKSLNATIKSEGGHTEESKSPEKVDLKTSADNDADTKKDVIERS